MVNHYREILFPEGDKKGRGDILFDKKIKFVVVKRFLCLLSAVVVLIQSGLFIPFLLFEQQVNKNRCQKNIREGCIENALELKMSFTSFQKSRLDDQEIFWQGKYYDVISSHSVEDGVVLYVVADESETAISEKLSEAVEHEAQDPLSCYLLKKVFSFTLAFKSSEYMIFIVSYLKMNSCYSNFYSSCFSDAVFLPPRQV